ncbi:UBX domain-containing protein [Aphelenchoides bicaudatus]|nr:UBX domain-containing protein [Aphelenchoides bicaudatus]
MDVVSQDLINQFKEFTGSSSDDVARQTLKACDGSLEQAVGLFFASDGAIEANAQANQPPVHVDQPVIIDSDDEDIQVINELNNPIVLDESEGEEGVRRPMAPVSGQLFGGTYRQYYGERESRQPIHPVFEQYHDLSETGRHRRGDSENADSSENGTRNLAALFRPPIDIMERCDWDSLLRVARERNRWVLVNVQDASEFACQVLNRDCWSNEQLKQFIKSNFLFWQAYITSTDGRRVVGYYGLKTYPAIFIVDPRTSEMVHSISKEKSSDMINELADFYESHPTFVDYDAKLRAKILPKPSTSGIDFSLDDDKKSVSNGVSEQSTSKKPEETAADQPTSSLVAPETVSTILAAPVEQPSAESLRERREKFLRQFENN